MGVTPTIQVDYVAIEVTHAAPSGQIFVDEIGLDPIDEKGPTANNSTDCSAWSNPSNAETSNNKYAQCSSSSPTFCNTMYDTFGFNIPNGNVISKVRVKLEHLENTSGDFAEVNVGHPGSPDTCGNMITDATATFPNRPSETSEYVDITSQKSWVPSDFDNANLRILLNGYRGIL